MDANGLPDSELVPSSQLYEVELEFEGPGLQVDPTHLHSAQERWSSTRGQLELNTKDTKAGSPESQAIVRTSQSPIEEDITEDWARRIGAERQSIGLSWCVGITYNHIPSLDGTCAVY